MTAFLRLFGAMEGGSFLANRMCIFPGNDWKASNLGLIVQRRHGWLNNWFAIAPGRNAISDPSSAIWAGSKPYVFDTV
jgi:hypothetical protein